MKCDEIVDLLGTHPCFVVWKSQLGHSERRPQFHLFVQLQRIALQKRASQVLD